MAGIDALSTAGGAASGLAVSAGIEARLSWSYEPRAPRLRALYEHGKRAQWNAAIDIDWDVDVPFGEPLPADSAWASSELAASPLRRLGPGGVDAFRWEFQAWMVSQFLHGEQGALCAASRLTEVLPDLESKLYAANQAADEARHVEAFARYVVEKLPTSYPVSPPLEELLRQILGDARWDIVAIGMQILIEGIALAAFRLANATFHDPLIKQISDAVSRDEARHVSFGVLSLKGRMDQLTAPERAEREELVLEASALMRQRFLLEAVWERLGVPVDEGREFALNSPLMVAYRQTVFAKVTSALRQIGLMTPRVRAGLDDLGLTGRAERAGIALNP